jgi:hypothetical protein
MEVVVCLRSVFVLWLNVSCEHTFMRRPRLKRRCIARNRREVTIMQPVKDLLLLTHTRISLAIIAILASSVPQSGRRSSLICLVIVRFLPATANEEHVTNLDVAALSRRSDVNTLVFAALIQLFPRDGVVVIRVVVDALLVSVAAVV